MFAKITDKEIFKMKLSGNLPNTFSYDKHDDTMPYRIICASGIGTWFDDRLIESRYGRFYVYFEDIKFNDEFLDFYYTGKDREDCYSLIGDFKDFLKDEGFDCVENIPMMVNNNV